ncbi:SlyX family protein [Alkalimonas delamerensis]|uniref:Protein SlyX homolog n=1 Tax=Alkalimonas delamerensis TaxID=265981 RepID=A0ABT9GQ84_9GAMM|nr:SlyX family protein [Alkalimonas delamerensis]MDP4529059.1 SlyX family protein [Alkalimonas delamerensis]
MSDTKPDELELHIIELESKIAFQDDAMQHLSKELLQHQKQIKLLQQQVLLLAKQLQRQDQDELMPQEQEPPPPHY